MTDSSRPYPWTCPGQGRSGRAGQTPRCPRCALHLRLCLCPLLRPLATEARVVVVTHFLEACKTTNTARLVPLTLRGGEVRIRGAPGLPLDLTDLEDPSRQALLLYPAAGARVLDDEFLRADPRPKTLVVPDGTWRQAGKTVRREVFLRRLPTVVLPPGPPSRYRLRAQHDPRGLATFEAVARALGVLDGPEVQERLEDVFEVFVERTLWSRGVLSASAVRGGVPPAASPRPPAE